MSAIEVAQKLPGFKAAAIPWRIRGRLNPGEIHRNQNSQDLKRLGMKGNDEFTIRRKSTARSPCP
jgi:hypothetical protein